MDKKIKILIVSGVAIVGGIVGFWLLGNYRDSKRVIEEKTNKILEENK